MPIKPYLQLMRPANIVTAIADVLAGLAIASHLLSEFKVAHLSLIIATVGLYGGGVVLNDAFDAKLDAIERPERPIPSGSVSEKNAYTFGFLLLILGCFAAWVNHYFSGMIAMGIACLAILYNRYGKHHSFLGPINMGMCRGGNLLLGMSANGATMTEWWPLAVVAVIYISAITMVSRGEVTGGSKKTLYVAGILYLVVMMTQLYVAYYRTHQFIVSGILSLTFALFIFQPLIKAIKNPIGCNIGKAVKAGVLSLILMDAVWCMVFDHLNLGLITLSLFPISILLSKFFAVT